MIQVCRDHVARLLVAVCLSAAVAAADNSALSPADTRVAIDRFAAECSAIETMRVEFIQEKHLALLPRPVATTGTIYFRHPAAIRLDITSPERAVTIVDGDRLAKYEAQGDNWRRLAPGNSVLVSAVLGRMAAWMRGDIDTNDGLFEISGRLSDGVVTIVLTPAQARSRRVIDHLALTLAADGSRVESLKIVEPGANFTVMRFTAEQRDIPLAPAVFATDRPTPAPVGGGP